MNLLKELKNINTVSDFTESSNFYYDYHNCSASGNKEKIMMDFTISNELTDEILKFGICDKCRLCIYHKDFKGSSF